MTHLKGKISVRQSILLAFTVLMPASVRIIPNYVAVKAKQAGWLAPIISFGVMTLVAYMLSEMSAKYKDAMFTDIMNDICGVFAGKLILTLYIVWLAVLTALYTRYYAERLLSTILPNTSIYLFIVIMILSVVLMLRKSIVVIVRMNEMMIPFFLLMFAGIIIFSIPEVNIKNLIPVSYLDIAPIAKAGIGIIGIWAYFPLFFLFSSVVHNKPEIKKYGVKAAVIITVMTVLIIGMCVGIFGSKVVEIMPVPFFGAVRQINLFNTIERIESIVVSIWVFSDFILIAVFFSISMDMLKSLLGIAEAKSLIGVYGIIIYFLSFYISRNLYELLEFSNRFYIHANIVFGIGIPALVFLIGKIRKKI